MTDQQLVFKLQSLVKEERRITHEILVLIKEAEYRKIYAERGYPSAFEWLVKEFGYSESAAYRRIQAARLLGAVPEVGDKLQSGEVNLSTLAKVQSVIRSEEKRIQAKVSFEMKTEILRKIEGKNTKETEETLAGLFPEVIAQRADRVVVTSEDSARMTVTLSSETLKDLERVKELLSHAKPGAQWSEIIEYLAKDFLKQRDPLRKQSVMPSNTAAVSLSSRKSYRVALPAALKRAVYQRDQGRCQYRDPKSGTICESKYLVEIDHIMPKALGGDDTFDNLRCLCRSHNQLRAHKTFGRPLINDSR